MYNIIWLASCICSILVWLGCVIYVFTDRSILGKSFAVQMAMMLTVSICLLIENRRTSIIELYLKSGNLKGLTLKENENIKRELDVLRWAVGLIFVMLMMVVTYLLNHKVS